MRKFGKSLAVIAGAAAATLFFMNTAYAADGPLSASRSGVSATASVDFTGRYHFYINNLALSDTSCDSSSVYVEIKFHYFDGNRTATTKTSNSGCNSTAYFGQISYTSGVGHVDYVWLRVCVDSIGGNECTAGSSQSNPYP